MNRREFCALTAGAALGGVVAGAVANHLAPVAPPHVVPACMEMSPDLPQSNTAFIDRVGSHRNLWSQRVYNEVRSSALSAMNFGAGTGVV